MSRKLRKNGESELRRTPYFENLESRHLLSGNPIITEFMASNESTLQDNAFPRKFSDWIEIYNAGDEAMDLAGWHLTDRPNNLYKWTFPSVILPAEGFLHVFASGNDVPDDSGNLHTNFSLDSDGEYLALVEPDGTALASEFGSADVDYPEQFSDVSYGFTQELVAGGAINTLEDQLRYFQAPTPGHPNIPGSKDLGPIISGTTQPPDVPDFGEDVVVSAMVRAGAGTLNNVLLRYRVGFGGHTNVTMLDDGTTGGDEIAGDGVYTATILAAGEAAAGEMVRWYVEAFDTDGHNSRWPLFQKSSGERQSEIYLGTVVADPAVMSQLPIYQLFVQNPGAADRRSGTRASMFFDGEFYDNVFIRERGNSSAALSKTNHRINFNRDHLFRADDSGYRFQKVNLQANMADPAYMRETLEAETFRRAGVPTIRAEQVRLEMNGNFFQLAGFVEHVDGDFLNRVGLDPDGALYKNPIMLNKFATNGRGPWSDAEKITRIDIDGPGKNDLRDLVYGIYEGNSDDDRARFILDNVDIPAAINYMASFHVTQEADSMHINVMVYRDSDGTGEWRWLPFDMNFSFGQWFAADFVTGNQDKHFGHPFYGAEGFEPDVRNYSFSRLQDAIISTPETRQMYLRRLRTLMDEFLRPPGTPAEDLYFESRLAEYQRAMQQDADLDRKINGHAFGQTSWTNLPPMTFSDGVQQLIRDYLVQRRTHLYITHSIDNPAYDPNAPISDAMPAGIPHAQVGVPAINFGDLQYNPVSGNQDEEYIELVNPNATAVDLSGWQVTGGVEFAFQPGTVIPSGGSLYLSPNVTAFRARATGPSGGQRLFVQGGYRGHLSSHGETLQLFDASGREVNSLSYEGQPSDVQQFLRISELMFHPADDDGAGRDGDDFEFIELVNTGPAPLNLAGVHFTSGVQFTFVDVTLPPSERLVLVKNIEAFAERYDTAAMIVAGPFTSGTLDNGGEKVKLEDAETGTILEFRYDDDWYRITDGVGFSISVIDVTADFDTWGDRAIWRPSSELHGSPGRGDTFVVPAPKAIVVNEVLAHSDAAAGDWIELHNTTDAEINLGGWYLSDDRLDPLKYEIPADTKIQGLGFATFTQLQHFGEKFVLSELGSEVIVQAAHDGAMLGFRARERFSASDNGRTLGRFIKSTGGKDFVAMESATFGAANSDPLVGPIVIHEIMYHPVEDVSSEFVELMNISDASVPLAGWHFTGIKYVFGAEAVIDPGELIVVVPFDPEAFRASHNVPRDTQLFGPYLGALSNAGESLRLNKLGEPEDEIIPSIMVDRVSYDDKAPWPVDADGTGAALQRITPSQYGNEPTNWGVTLPGGTPGDLFILPTVSEVLVSGSKWSSAVFDRLSAAGSGQGGFPIPAGADQLQSLPWTGLDQISIRFSEHVNVTSGDLLVSAANVIAYDVTGFQYDRPSRTATWSLGQTVGADKLLIELQAGVHDESGLLLDGNWIDVTSTFPSGNGVIDSDDAFRFRINVVAGDVTSDGRVDRADLVDLIHSLGDRSATVDAVRHDLNGDGRIDALDLRAGLLRQGARLPVAEPQRPGSAAPRAAVDVVFSRAGGASPGRFLLAVALGGSIGSDDSMGAQRETIDLRPLSLGRSIDTIDRLGRRDRSTLHRANRHNDLSTSRDTPLRRLQAAAVDRALSGQSAPERVKFVRLRARSSSNR